MVPHVQLSKKQRIPENTAASPHKTNNMEGATEPTVPSAQNFSLNLLKPSGYFTYHQFNIKKISHAARIVFMCFV
jgi:hypothetical protein